MKNIILLLAILVLFSSSTFADEKNKVVIVRLPQLNICYNAEIKTLFLFKNYIVAISDKVQCGKKPAIIMNLVSVAKEGHTGQCIYTVGKYLNVKDSSLSSRKHNFVLRAECPPAKK